MAVVVVAHDSGAELTLALESLPRSEVPLEVVVVDHASTDGSLERVRARCPWARLVPLDQNRGFAAGCNLGVELTGADLVLFLNPDCVVHPGALERLVGRLEGSPDVGIVGPKLRHPDGRLQASAYRFPGLATESARLLGLGGGMPRRVFAALASRRLLPDTGHFHPHDTPRQVDFVTGACMLVRRAVLEDVGGFDEGFFLYYEEIDLCRRAAAAGWRVMHEPGAEVTHAIGGSSRGARRVTWVARHLSRLRFHRRYGGTLRNTVLRGLVLVTVGARWLLEATRGALPGDGVRNDDRIRASDCALVLRATATGRETPGGIALPQRLRQR